MSTPSSGPTSWSVRSSGARKSCATVVPPPRSESFVFTSVLGGFVTVPNTALRQAMADARMTEQALARSIGVDEKMVGRWVARDDRVPHPRHRWAACEALGVDEAVIWPDAIRAAVKTGPDRDIDAIEASPLTVSTRIAVTLEQLERLSDVDGIEARFSDRHIALSVFSFDDDMIVTPHLANLAGHESPALHLRRCQDDGIFDRFTLHVSALATPSAKCHQEGWTSSGRDSRSQR